MSFRHIPIIAGLLITLGGAVAVAESIPQSRLLLSQATAPTSPTASPRKQKWLQNLNLSSEQTQQLQTIRSQSRNQMSETRQQLKQSRQELMSLMAGTASDDQIRAKYRDVETAQQKLSQQRFESLLAMRNILTPEQRQKFAQQMQQRREAGPHRRNPQSTPAPTPGN
jgi:protein CpxP